MFELFVASDAARRQIKDSLEPKSHRAAKGEQVRPRRVRVRSTSAAVLRTLVDRLEPSPTI